MPIKLNTPLERKKITGLKAGDFVLLSGEIIGARDAAHRRIIDAMNRGGKLPVNLSGQAVFYVGPSPAPPGKASGSFGPTTSARMDSLTEPLLQKGLCATIGKGARSDSLKELLVKYGAVYFIAPPGVAAYLAKKVKKISVAAYDDLGPEAIFKIEVKDLPLFVAYDAHGGDIFNLS